MRAISSIRSASPDSGSGLSWTALFCLSSSIPMMNVPPSTAKDARSRASSLLALLPAEISRLRSR